MKFLKSLRHLRWKFFNPFIPFIIKFAVFFSAHCDEIMSNFFHNKLMNTFLHHEQQSEFLPASSFKEELWIVVQAYMRINYI